MKILSLFDGMACGAIAFTELGLPIDRYVAFEIDKYAVKVASHNFPFIEQRGDVFEADFTEFNGFDWLVGGSPCTHWSITKSKTRETTASGLGWELFNQYVRALHEAKPKYFLYENNKSMSKEIRASITETFGFEPIHINSALVSAQNRERLYWVGVRRSDGTYSKVDAEQPSDNGFLLKDVAEDSRRVPSNFWYSCGWHFTGKKSGHIAELEIAGHDILKRVYSLDSKAPTCNTCGGGNREGKVMQDGRPRKLMPIEHKRLQTVPDWYDFSVISNSQAYKCLGNGWTVDVVTHLINSV